MGWDNSRAREPTVLTLLANFNNIEKKPCIASAVEISMSVLVFAKIPSSAERSDLLRGINDPNYDA
jgi:hypothetical protein